MATLNRSAVFRRQGSSGLIWEDRFFSGDLNLMKQRREAAKRDNNIGELRRCQSVAVTTVKMMESGQQPKVSPAMNPPPSPKLSGCCFFCHFPRKLTQKKALDGMNPE